MVWVACRMDSLDTPHPGTGNNNPTAATTWRTPGRLAPTGLIVAVVASVFELAGESTGRYLPTLIRSWNLNPLTTFNLFGFFHIYVVGVLGIVAVLLAVRSLKRSASRRGLAGAALALGIFHIAHMIIIPLTTWFGPGF